MAKAGANLGVGTVRIMDTKLELVEEIRQHVYEHGLDATVAQYADTLASWPGEAAGVWLRVSSGKQDEANQLPDVLRHCAERDYRPATWYVLHDKSAAKGEQQSKLDEMLEDVRDRAISVCVCWHGDRMERRGGLDLLRILADVKDAGGHVESVQQRNLGLETMGDRITSFIEGETSHQYIVHLTEQVKVSHDRIRANRAFGPGGVPWGYKVVGEKYNKKLVADEAFIREADGRPKHYAADIFEHCIAGDSCRTIAIWLDSEGVKPVRGDQWNERSVWQIIHNMAYAGRRQDEGTKRSDGKPTRKNRRTIMRCEAVVSMDLWQRANDALAKRPGRGPGVNGTLQPKPLLVNLKCARCADSGIDSPMYRVRTYYRCSGRGTRRKGCGNMIRLEPTDQIVRFWVYLAKTIPYRTRQWVGGTSYDNQISNLVQELAELPRKFDPLSDEYDEAELAIKAQIREYRRKNESAKPGHHENTYVRKSDGSTVTEDEYDALDEEGRADILMVSEHFAELDKAGQREYLRTFDIRVEKATALNGSKGARLVIDGQDWGVWPYIAASESPSGDDASSA